LTFACKSVLHAWSLSKNRNTALILIDAIIDAELIFSLAFTIAYCGAVISFQEAIVLSHHRDTALICIQTLILAILIEALTGLPYAFYPPHKALIFAEYRHTTIILFYAVIDSQLIICSAFLIASARAFCSVIKALLLAEDGHTRIVLTHTGIHAFLVVTGATCCGACQFFMHTLLCSLDWDACIVFCLAIV
jgi:hypothetical protein